MKKVVFILLTWVTCISMSPWTYPSEDILPTACVKVNGFYYSLYPDAGTATLVRQWKRPNRQTSPYARLKKADIPPFIQHKGQSYKVTAIGDYTFEECYGLESVCIPSTVTYIGNFAFHGCASLQEVIIPDSVNYVGRAAFASCYSLQSVKLPDELQSIGIYTFRGCDNLQSICLPAHLKLIEQEAFEDCISLSDIHLPDSLETIESNAFTGCSALQSITLPKSLKRMAFDCLTCINLTAIHVDSGHPLLCSIEGTLYSKDTTQLVRFPCGKQADSTVVVPERVTAIWPNAFHGCRISGIVLPPGISTIDKSVFCWCDNLTSITVPEGVTSIGNGAFQTCKRLHTVTLPSTLGQIEEGAFFGCNNLTTIISNAPTPPVCERHAFATLYFPSEGASMAHIRFYVPEQSIELYRAAEGWNSEEFIYYPLSEYQPKP